ncbi:NUDIX hydrolase [Dyadobacter sandarakinus]|uniref:NUDIX hydrolase n=1 Tax=Dyadobacter sandarakinus TaxID=2747268 RepID=A0ABX7I6M9_9BACT|nr:NUDIX hydrolase [Dyadobacter sandarakinus]QRR01757.1 NUDIX hydrolase [Dyadobacter sandarakinus]
MERDSLIRLLEAYQPEPGQEAGMYLRTLAFVKAEPDCFERTLLKGHVTASGWVLSPDKNSVLLLHHRKLDKWFQPGGHCDGDPDVVRVARKEVEEETGLTSLQFLQEGVFDVDIHTIPAGKDTGEHEHFDVRFAFLASESQQVVINNESRDVRWIPLEEVPQYNHSESILRMVRKVTV